MTIEITDEMVLIAARAGWAKNMARTCSWDDEWDTVRVTHLRIARAVIEVVAPMIAAAERELCAVAAKSAINELRESGESDLRCARDSAVSAIRARGNT